MIKKGDIVVIILAIMLMVALVVFLTQDSFSEAERVIIKTSTQTFIYPITIDQIITIDGLTIQIKDKEVRVIASTCPNHICMQGSISSSNQSLACLPNGVLITIEGKEEVDDVVY